MSEFPDSPEPAPNGTRRTAASGSGEATRASSLDAVLRNYPSLQDGEAIRRIAEGGLPLVIENVRVRPADRSLASSEPAARWRSPASEPLRAPGAPPSRSVGVGSVAGIPLDLALLPVPDPFVDRDAELEWLTSRLGRDGASRIVAVCGMGGIGKTGLVAKALSQLYDEGRFPDGIAVVLCQNLEDAHEVLKLILARFDPERRQPDSSELDVLREDVFRALRGKDALVVLDNVEAALDIEAVVPPLRAAGVAILLTARAQISAASVPKENCLLLELLSPKRALELLARSYGKPDADSLTATDKLAAMRIVEILDSHTLAVRLAGAYAADVGRDLATLATELEDPGRTMALSAGGRERSVAVVFEESLGQLASREAELFAALSVFNGPDFGRRAAIALAATLERGDEATATVADEVPVETLVRRALLSAFTNAAMPADSDRERLRLHPLLCTLASDRLNSNEWTDQRRQLVTRLVANYYVRYGRGKKVTTLSPDESNVRAALEAIHEQEQHDLVVVLCLTLRRFWLDGWRTRDSLHYLPWGIAAAEVIAAADPTSENRLYIADLLRTYGQVLRRAGRLDEAGDTLQRALRLCQEDDDAWREAATLSQLGRVSWARAQLKSAYDYFVRSSQRFRDVGGDRQREGANLGYLGRIAQARGKLAEAQNFYEDSLDAARAMDDRHGERLVLFDLGQVALARGYMKEAEKNFDRSMEICKEEHDYQGESDILTGKGRIALNRRQFDVARGHFQKSLKICEEVGDRQGMGVNYSQLGQVALEEGQLDEAEQYIQKSRVIRDEVKDRRGEGVDVSLLARIALRRGWLDEAKDLYGQALSIAQEVQNRRGEGVDYYYLATIAEATIAEQRDNIERAEKMYQESVAIARETENGPDIARAQRALGRFLIKWHGDHQRGDPLLIEAAQRLDTLELPDAEEAHKEARELGAERDLREPVRALFGRLRGYGRRE